MTNRTTHERRAGTGTATDLAPGRTDRAIVGVLLVATGLLLAALAVYAWRGEALIRALYEGRAPAWVPRVIEGQAVHPLGRYVAVADMLFGLGAGLAASLVLTLALAVRPGLPRVYAWTVAGLDACDRRLSCRVAGAAIVLVILLVVAGVVLQGFPNSADEYVNTYQARTLAAGRFVNAAHALPAFFQTMWVAQDGAKLYGIYLPGLPVLMAGAMRAGLPPWVVNPALGVVSLLLVRAVGTRLYGGRAGTGAALLAGVSAFFLFTSASLFPHALLALMVLLTLWSGLRFGERPEWRFALLTGAFTGLAVLARPLCGVLGCAVAIVFAALRTAAKGRLLAGVILGGLPCLGVLLAYNHALTGHFLSMPYAMQDVNMEWGATWRSRAYALSYLRQFVAWTPVFLLPAYVLVVPACLRNPRRELTGVTVLLLAAAYFFYQSYAGNQYGPRYYYGGFFLMCLPVAARLFREDDYREKTAAARVLFAALVLSLIWNVPLVAWHARREHRVVWERREPFRLAGEAGLRNAVVFLRTGSGVLREMPECDLTRNDLDYTNSVLYVMDLGPRNAELMAYYPDRQFFAYERPAGAAAGRLVKLEPPDGARSAP